ncbi:MAG: hypothetical protein ACAI35_10965 [Candidatus Methylacidiphilales bacterium]
MITVGFLIFIQTIRAGAVPQLLAAHDCAIFYDAGWRAYCGSIPHIDFYSPLGPATYLYVAAGYCFFGLTVHSLAYMNAITFVILLGITWYCLHGRISDFWLFWAALLVALCSIAPHSLRFSIWELSYAMLYNRQGNSLLILLVLLLYCPHGTATERQFKVGSIVAGSVISILCFLKANFGMASVAAAFVYFIIERNRWVDFKYFILSFVLVSFAFVVYLKFDISAMQNDLSIAADAKSSYFLRYPRAHRLTFLASLAPVFVSFLLLCCGVFYLSKASPTILTWRRMLKELIIYTTISGLAMFIILSNSIWGYVEHPLLIALGIIICSRFVPADSHILSRRLLKTWNSGGLLGACLILCTSVITLPYVGFDILSVYISSMKIENPAVLESPEISDLTVGQGVYGTSFVRKTNDAVHLMSQYNLEGKSMMVLEFSTLIPFTLRIPSVGGCVFWDNYNNITKESHPTPERTVQNASYVLIPKFPENPQTSELLEACYLPYIKEHYHLLNESSEWVLWERAKPESGK